MPPSALSTTAPNSRKRASKDSEGPSPNKRRSTEQAAEISDGEDENQSFELSLDKLISKPIVCSSAPTLMWALSEQYRPHPLYINYKLRVFNALSAFMLHREDNFFPGYVIRITGSTIHGFGLHKSDLDVLVTKRSGEVHRSSLKDRTAALDKKIQRFYNKIRKGKRLDLDGSTLGRTLEEPQWQRHAITRLMEIVFADSTDTIKPLIQLESLELDISFQQ